MRSSITWQNFKEGDILIDLSGNKCIVMGKMGKVFARSGWHNFNSYQDLIGTEDAKKKGWRFIQPNGKVQMTREEVEKFIGNPIEII